MPLTSEQTAYVRSKVDEWIAAGDVIEEHRQLCFDATVNGYLMMMSLGKTLTVEEWCEVYHAQLKAQETMDPDEFARIKRLLDRARRKLKR